ncbi:SUMF1/EgtB/PvdO family nonheme iron enzyme, partial [Salmonella enterica subsp. enterica serovar Weltevreden]|uniref:SUMF1/EgtB/PvdO family nonheme iron enzyme n=2 Tax=Pseudomonadota TaxID=1224 RepID=UPI0029C3494B
DMKTFKISRTLVSNAEFLTFIQAGGYENDQYWSMAGLKWRNSNRARHPLFWKEENGIWLERHFDQWLPVQAELPVKHVSYWEAQAYCKFAGRR